MPYDIDEIISICQQFRSALENPVDPPDFMGKFPLGWCGHTARALGGYLLSKGFGPIQYVSGYRGAKSHAWNELGDIIIDITADQFEDCTDTIIVSINSDFHNRFTDIKRRLSCPEDLCEYPESWIVRISVK